MFQNKSLSKKTFFFFKESRFLSNLHVYVYKTLKKKKHFGGVLFLVNVGTKAKSVQ